MQNYDFQDPQSIAPIAFCEHCQGEIYAGDYIYNLDEVYMNGQFLVHEDCGLKDLEENKDLVTKYLFDDLCRLQDIFSELLLKSIAGDIFYKFNEDCDKYE